jgi:hypothetical protein
MYLSFEKTAVFHIPFTFMFLSFVYFLCSIICYTIIVWKTFIVSTLRSIPALL